MFFPQIAVPADQWMAVEKGDHLGFTWTQGGVVTYDAATGGQKLYCEKQVHKYTYVFCDGKSIRFALAYFAGAHLRNIRVFTLSHWL